MKTKVLIEAGYQGRDLQRIDVNGINVNKLVPLTKNFNRADIIGMVKPYIEDNKMYVDIDIEGCHLGLYPAMAFMAKDCEIDEINRVRLIKSAELYEISLCSWPNVDPNIKPLE